MTRSSPAKNEERLFAFAQNSGNTRPFRGSPRRRQARSLRNGVPIAGIFLGFRIDAARIRNGQMSG